MHRTDELAVLTGQVTKAGGAPLADAVVTVTDTAGVKQFGEGTTAARAGATAWRCAAGRTGSRSPDPRAVATW